MFPLFLQACCCDDNYLKAREGERGRETEQNETEKSILRVCVYKSLKHEVRTCFIEPVNNLCRAKTVPRFYHSVRLFQDWKIRHGVKTFSFFGRFTSIILSETRRAFFSWFRNTSHDPRYIEPANKTIQGLRIIPKYFTQSGDRSFALIGRSYFTLFVFCIVFVDWVPLSLSHSHSLDRTQWNRRRNYHLISDSYTSNSTFISTVLTFNEKNIIVSALYIWIFASEYMNMKKQEVDPLWKGETRSTSNFNEVHRTHISRGNYQRNGR
jgi:hypothetical protein